MDVPKISEILEAFDKATLSKVTCRDITGKSFTSVNDHTEHMKNGGCSEIINTLAEVAKT